MSLSRSSLGKIFKSARRGGGRYGDHALTHPEREWVAGLGICLVLLVVGGWYAASMFLKYRSAGIENVTAANSVDPTNYREGEVAGALDLLGKRRAETTAITARLKQGAVAPPTESEDAEGAASTVPAESLPASEEQASTSTPTALPAEVDGAPTTAL